MAEILIKGMEMLPEGFAYDVRIRGNGDIVDRLTGVVMGKAIEVPPHGALADKKIIYEKMVENIKIANKEDFGSKKAKEAVIMAYKAVLYELENEIPTIIEASTEGEASK